MEYFNLPTNVIIGAGCIAKNADSFASFGETALIITGKNSAVVSGALADVISSLDNKGIRFSIFDKMSENPMISVCRQGGNFAKNRRAEFIIAIGGGSVIDGAKCAAIYATNPTITTTDIYALNWQNDPLPLIAVGLTAGTGSEVTSIAVITDDSDKRKKSISREDLYPKISFCDFEYTRTMNYKTTVSTAIDGLCHALEGYFSNNNNPITDEYSFLAVKSYVSQLRRLSKNQNVISTDSFRKIVHEASIMAGITLNTCKTAFPHLLGYLLTEDCIIPHGYACSAFIGDYVALSIYEKPERAELLSQKSGFEYPDLFGIITHFNDEYFNENKSNLALLTENKIEENRARIALSNNRINSPGSPETDDLFKILNNFLKTYNR